ncbi:hypothetical protein ACQUQQ_01000 [Acidithiobacillus ferrooxidans]|jgi:hypothetical protein|uniref:hypothetical protein n=1 Tax=Acidithiobacillus TaxID=119977 RepID=UPI000A9A45C1|nr:hypothetical protein [Acidithiobacillus ferridurans]MBU2803635.1 hypothetical protein [Acidithiobacillus ferridurans]
MPSVHGQVKLVGRYADRVEKEAGEKRVSKAAVITEYALRGIEAADSGKDGEWASLERRISATLLAMRGDVEAVQSELDTLTAMFDLFVKLMLLHLPEPVLDEAEAVRSSALTRYERFLRQVAENGFDGDRPQALRKIARLLEVRVQGGDDDA